MPQPADRADPFTRRMLPWLLFAITLALTLALAAWCMQRNAAERAVLFEHRTEAFRLSLASAVRSQLDILPSLRAAASDPAPLDDAQFLRYADNMLGAGRHPGLTLTFVAERVHMAGRAAFVERVRNDRSADRAGRPSFDIQPAGARPEYMPLRHQYPADPTNDGYDLYDPNQNYRQAVEGAIAAGGLVATAPLLLARDRHRPNHPELNSIVVRAATYRGGRALSDVEARGVAATGVVGIAFRSAELVRSALPAELTAQARVRVVDVGSEKPVYDSEPGADLATAALRAELPMADRQWRIEVAPPPLAWWQHADEDTLILLAIGAVFATLLAALTAGLARTRRPTDVGKREPVAQRDEAKPPPAPSETQQRLLFERNVDAMLITRPGGGIVAANPAACALLGRSEAELIAAARGDVIDLEDPRLPELMAERAAIGHARGEICLRRGDGSVFEADVSSMTYLDADGSELASITVREIPRG